MYAYVFLICMCNVEIHAFISDVCMIQILFLLVETQLASKSPTLGMILVTFKAIMRFSSKNFVVL